MSTKPIEKTPEEIEIEENDLKVPAIVTKYQIAGDLANRSLLTVLKEIKKGANIKELCSLGDSTIASLSKTVFNKGNVKKGIAFPTTVSPRNYICNLSPLEADPESKITLEEGDLVRVELGVHVDGYIAQVGKTVVVGSDKVSGKKADVIKAVHVCAEAALRLVKPGETNVKFTESIGTIAKDFGLIPVEGMLTSQILRNVLDGPNQVHQNAPEDAKKSITSFTFEQGQVYTISLLLSTSTEGKTKAASDARTTIYKRNPDAVYQLKMKTSRLIFSQVQKEFGSMAFQLGSLEDEKKARMGIIECTTHGLVTPYQVLQEKQDDAELASVVVTVLLMPNGPLVLSPAAVEFDADRYVSEKNLENAELKALLETPVRISKKKK